MSATQKARMKEEVPDLKVGDRVVMLRAIDFDIGSVSKGDKGTISALGEENSRNVEVQMEMYNLRIDVVPGRDICVEEMQTEFDTSEVDPGLSEFWSSQRKDSFSAPYNFPFREDEEMVERSRAYFELLNSRRSCRSYSSEKVCEITNYFSRLVLLFRYLNPNSFQSRFSKIASALLELLRAVLICNRGSILLLRFVFFVFFL